jgi:hypothetical protein
MAEATDGTLLRLECGRTREELVAELVARAADDPPPVVGFDFSFSLPAWFLASHGWSRADALWQAAADSGESWLAECAPPFWGRPGAGRPAVPEHFRRTEASLPAVGGTRPKSTFQVGGVGSVGTGSIRGFPILARLRAAGFRIWPFHDSPVRPVVVEIYPRRFTGPVVKSQSEARRALLDDIVPAIGDPFRAAAIESEDAFDALLSACAMSRAATELAALPVVDDDVLRLEGVIWVPASQRAVPPELRTA